MKATWRSVGATLGGLLSAGACEPAPPTLAAFRLRLPLPAVCAVAPDDLTAEAFVSGYEDARPLDVDPTTGETTGTFEVAAGIDRRLVIDWIVTRGGTRIVVAQARSDLALRAPEGDELAVSLATSDIKTTDCRDVTGDLGRIGVAFVNVDGEERAVCDLDGDCGDPLKEECSNLGELCVGSDPLVP